MRRILRENLWAMAIIGAFVLVVAFAKVGWGQKSLTPEQQIEVLTVSNKGLGQQVFDDTNDKIQLNIRIVTLNTIIEQLQKSLAIANAKIAKLEMKPEEKEIED